MDKISKKIQNWIIVVLQEILNFVKNNTFSNTSIDQLFLEIEFYEIIL